MRRVLFLFLVSLISLNVKSQTSGGPDAYGYSWHDINDTTNSLTYSWIDITTIGTQLTGLTDDNSVGSIPMSSFHYYTQDVTQLHIGSNGWLSFDNVSNIAHCFPAIPTSGGANNIVAPFMSDLIFTGAGNPAEVWYYDDIVGGRFIVSFFNVPWWHSIPPGYIGSNTFQVILSRLDSSITFQYGDVDQINFNNGGGCNRDLVIGIENNTGVIGLEHSFEVVPADSFAIKFEYPDSVLITLLDLDVEWNNNTENKGFFLMPDDSVSLSTQIKNIGNTAITTDVYLTTTVVSPTTTVYTLYDTITGNIDVDSTITILFPKQAPLSTGEYTINTTISNTQDINATNDILETEITVANVSTDDISLSHVRDLLAVDGTMSFIGSWGGAVYHESPSYPVELNRIDAYVNGIGATQEFYIEIYDDDGTPGLPGSLLLKDTVLAGSYTYGGINSFLLSNPISVVSGGLFIAFRFNNDSTLLGTISNHVASRQSYENIGSSWVEYRWNDIEDISISSHYERLCTQPPISSFNDSINGLSVSFTNNTSTVGVTSYLWDFGDGNTSTQVNPIHTYLSPGVYTVCLTASNNCGTDSSCAIINVPDPCVGRPSVSWTYSDSATVVDFSNNSIVIGLASYLWDFGDGNTSTMQNPTHTYAVAGSYVVCLTVTDSCATDSTCGSVNLNTVSTEKNKLSEIKIYPNPTYDFFTLIMEDNSLQSASILIYNLHGEKVMEHLISSKRSRIGVSLLSRGVYIIEVRDVENIIGRERLVIH